VITDPAYLALEASILAHDKGDTTAYDGSDAEPLRELTPIERDVVCRLINQAVLVDDPETARLLLIRHIIDPRRTD
jgi:hypothetical protein